MEIEKIVKKLTALGTSKLKHNVLIGGSFALKHIYEVLKRDTEDIDIIIYNFNKEQLDWIEECFEVTTVGSHYTSHLLLQEKSVLYITALLDGVAVKLNFIIYKDPIPFKKIYTSWNNISVVPLKAILDAKLEYNRPKDKADLLDIMMELNNPTDSHLPKDCISRPKSVKKETAKKNGFLSEL
jgi:hypothetical protein